MIRHNRYARGVEATAFAAAEGVRPHVDGLRVCVRESRSLGSSEISRGGWVDGFHGHAASLLTAAELRALAAALIEAADYLDR